MVKLKNSLYMSHITAGSNAPHLATLNSGGMLLEDAHLLLMIMHSDDDSRATRCRTICAPIKKIQHAQMLNAVLLRLKFHHRKSVTGQVGLRAKTDRTVTSSPVHQPPRNNQKQVQRYQKLCLERNRALGPLQRAEACPSRNIHIWMHNTHQHTGPNTPLPASQNLQQHHYLTLQMLLIEYQGAVEEGTVLLWL